MEPKTNIMNPNENIIIPSWINVDYFKNILAKDEPDSIAVKNFTPVAAIPPGENFTSVMLRIHMNLEMKGKKSYRKNLGHQINYRLIYRSDYKLNSSLAYRTDYSILYRPN